MVDMEIDMTFEQAVAHLTARGSTLLEALELVADELEEARVLDMEPEFLSPITIAAYRIVCREMRPLFF